MNLDIKLHKNDLPDDVKLGNVIAVDGEFMGLDLRRDPLCLIQLSSGNNDAHIIQLDRTNYKSSNAWRARGIWETVDKKEAKGGPFQSYVFYDKNLDKTYHLNYLIHHPGKDKSIYMRQMDMIVKSFKINAK